MDHQQKLTRRERERLLHRNQILAAALELFSERGYHNVSMHEIAKKAEFAIGTLYTFFENKESLYKALIMEKAEEFHRVLMAALAEEDDVLSVVDNYLATKATLFTRSVATLRLYFAETRGASFNIKAGLDKDIRRMYDKFLERLAAVLERGVREGVFRKIDPHDMAVALEGLVNAFLYRWLEAPEDQPYEASLPVIRDIFLRGVLAE